MYSCDCHFFIHFPAVTVGNNIALTMIDIGNSKGDGFFIIQREDTRDFSHERNRTGGERTLLPATPASPSPFCLLCDCVIPSGIPLYADLPDRKGFLRSRHDSGSFVVAAGSFHILSLIHNNVMGLDPVPCGTDRPFSLGYLVHTVLSKVLRICVMVSVGASIEKLLSGLLASIPAVYVFCIIELFQDPVVPAFLLEDNRAAPVFRMEPSHHISIIHMAFCDIQCPPS